MTEITATLVKTLRDRTGAGILICRSTLAETGGDLDAAIERLRDAQTTMAAKKADRVAVEGRHDRRARRSGWRPPTFPQRCSTASCR